MGIVFRQASKSVAVIGFGAMLGAGINYLYTQIFTQQEVGASRNLLNQGSILYLFLLVGTVSVVHTYVQRYDKNDPRRAVINTFSLFVPFLTTLLFCIPYFAFRTFIISRFQIADRPFVREFYGWLPVLGLLWSLMSLFEYYLVSRMKVAVAMSMREVVLRVANLLLMAGYVLQALDFHQFVIGTVLVHIIPVSLLYLLSARTAGFGISFNYRIFSRKEIRDVVHYAWYHMLLTVSMNLIGIMDTLLLSMFSKNGLADVAVYSMAMFLISILTIPFRALSGASLPRLNEAYLSGSSQLAGLFIRSSVNMQVASIGTWLLISCNLHNVTRLLKPEYAAIETTFLILSLGRLADMFTGLNTELIAVSNHYKFAFRLSAGLIIAILAGDRIFIPPYGLQGAAWVSAATLVIYNLVKSIYLYRRMSLNPFTRQTGIVILIGLLLYVLNHVLPVSSNLFLDTGWRSVLLAVLFAVGVLFSGAAPDVNAFAQTIRRRLPGR